MSPASRSVGGRRSEVGGRRSEVGGRRSEVGESVGRRAAVPQFRRADVPPFRRGGRRPRRISASRIRRAPVMVQIERGECRPADCAYRHQEIPSHSKWSAHWSCLGWNIGTSESDKGSTAATRSAPYADYNRGRQARGSHPLWIRPVIVGRCARGGRWRLGATGSCGSIRTVLEPGAESAQPAARRRSLGPLTEELTGLGSQQ